MRFSILLPPALITLVALVGPAAFAQTPDGETPAFETVCDPLHPQNGSATPGLFGLCVAFCEAQDCNTNPALLAACQEANPGDAFGTHDCACGDILDNYNRIRQPSDPTMPCILESCPCFDAAFLTAELSINGSCVDTAVQTLINGRDSQNCNAFAQTRITNSGAEICQAFDRDRDVDNVCKTTLTTIQGVSPEEVASCEALLQAHIAAQALTCN